MSEIKKQREALNQAIISLELGNNPSELYDPIKYMLSLGGKRMRPLLTLLAYHLSKDDWQTVINPALAVEVFHNFTLIHDDIMDEAPLRRGKLTVYKKWNKDIAILSGDVMMVKAYDLLLEVNSEHLGYIMRLFNKCAVEVCEGQQLDMNFEKIDNVSETDYIQMIKLKTAVLLGFSLELGGLLGGMNTDNAANLREFGIKMGIGFQLKDDILDVYGDQEKFGKQVGGDIIANKKTYLLIKALELADDNLSVELDKLIAHNELDPKYKVSSVMKIYDEIGIKAVAEEKMNQYFEEAFLCLDQIQIEKNRLQILKSFAKGLIHREN